MINSLFMLGSSYNKDRKISIMFMLGWIAYMFIGSDSSLGITFPIVNAIVFFCISISINMIKNKKINTILSIFSIIIWSIAIDIICYFFYPAITFSSNIFTYVLKGIIFNFKYIFSNILAICVINSIVWLINHDKVYRKKEENVSITQ